MINNIKRTLNVLYNKRINPRTHIDSNNYILDARSLVSPYNKSIQYSNEENQQ